MEKNTHVELSNKKGSLANCLLDNKTKIETLYATSNVMTMKSEVRSLVIAINDKPLDKKSVATKRFLQSLDRQRNKDGILTLVWNTILAGDNEQVI